MAAAAGDITYPRVPDGMRLYAIGDIHGRADLLIDLHRRMIRDSAGARPGKRVAVYLGDYVDRGPDSREVIESLLGEPLPGFTAHFLKGNHEDMLLRFLVGEKICEAWLANGGGATLMSYGIAAGKVLAAAGNISGDHAMIDLRGALADALPEQHHAFYQNLQLVHVAGDYVFVHAGLRPGVALEHQRDADLMWIREPFLHADSDFGAVVVHGHSIAASPQIHHNRIGIDTGAFATGRLTCLVLEGTSRSFIST